MTDPDNNLRADDLDRLGKALICLAKELWIVKDRQAVLEAALADAGITSSKLLDRYTPDDALTAKLAQERAALLDGLLNALEKPD